MLKNLVNRTKSATEKIDVKGAFGSVKNSTSEKLSSTKSKANKIIEKNWPKIEKVIIETMVSTAEDKLTNDSMLESLFETVYEVLPMPLRLVIPRKKFIHFFLT